MKKHQLLPQLPSWKPCWVSSGHVPLGLFWQSCSILYCMLPPFLQSSTGLYIYSPQVFGNFGISYRNGSMTRFYAKGTVKYSSAAYIAREFGIRNIIIWSMKFVSKFRFYLVASMKEEEEIVWHWKRTIKIGTYNLTYIDELDISSQLYLPLKTFKMCSNRN